MKVIKWNKNFTEDNHILHNPKVLTEHIRTKVQEKDGLKHEVRMDHDIVTGKQIGRAHV